MTDERHRPRHHITVPNGWLNDPNGLSWHKGQFHVFHQYHADKPDWGMIQWAHLTSPDLVHWTRQPVALSPSPGPDAGGCWSGCLVFDQGVPTAVYTGVEALGPGSRTQTVCLARGDDALTTLRRDPASPVVAGAPPGLDPLQFRDPFVWREAEGWAMVVGTGIPDQGGAVVLFRSNDLIDWRYEGPIRQRGISEAEPLWTGRVWECPQLLKVGDRHILIFSVWDDQRLPRLNYAVAAIGTFDGRRFMPDSSQRFDHGGECYAPAAFVAPDGRRLAWGWSWEGLSEPARLAQGWAGCLTFPRELSIGGDGRLAVAPARELVALRGRGAAVEDVTLTAAVPRVDGPMRGDVVEIEARMEPGDAARVGLVVRASPDGSESEKTLIAYDPRRQQLEVNRDAASVAEGAAGGSHAGHLALAHGEPLDLHVYVDLSLLEVFANGRIAFTERIYPSRTDSTHVAAFVEGGSARLAWLRMWELPGTSIQ